MEGVKFLISFTSDPLLNKYGVKLLCRLGCGKKRQVKGKMATKNSAFERGAVLTPHVGAFIAWRPSDSYDC